MGMRFVKPMMERYTIANIILVAGIISLLGGIYGFITAIVLPNTIGNIIAAMTIIATASGLIFPIANRLAIESSDEPMGSRVAIYSFLTSIFGMIASSIVTGFYNEKLFSFGLMMLVFCSIAFLILLILIKVMKKNYNQK
jgi:MFS family permease